jgi:hypothetical protein
MTNAQAQAAQNRILVLEDRIQSFNANITRWRIEEGSSLYTTIVTTITEFELEAHSLRESINTRREYLFNFKGGGWNSVTAYTLEEAIETATATYSGMDVDPATFRVSTPADEQSLLSLFY